MRSEVEVPEGWEIKHLHEVAEENKTRFDPARELCSLPYVGLEHIVPCSTRIAKFGTTEDICSQKTRFYPNDILFGKLRPYLKKVAIVDRAGVCSTDILAIRANNDVDKVFLLHLLSEGRTIQWATDNSAGTKMPRTSWKALGELKVYLPPLAEQRKIAEILSSVDEAIVATEAVIEQTRKVKEGLLQELLTKGIGHTRFKQTKIGEIPESWEVKRLGDVVESLDQQRVPIKASDRKKRQGHIPYYGASGVIDWVDDSLFDEPILLISEDGANLLTRNMPITFLEDGPCWVNNHAHVYRFQKDALLGYIAVYIESISLEPWITGSAQPKLNGKIAREIPLPIPPITEQKKIVQVAESISKSVSEHQKQLESLQQLKAGLLQDLLTGKVRVSP
jgi:type I restriction enzyme S subunit